MAACAKCSQFLAAEDNFCSRCGTPILHPPSAGGPVIETVAGDGTFAIDQLNNPMGLALDAFGNLFVADFNNHRVRKFSVASQELTTFAGHSSEICEGFEGDGKNVSDARFRMPTWLALDLLGNLYITDWKNQRIRKVTSTGTVSTVMEGTGAPAVDPSSGDVYFTGSPASRLDPGSGRISPVHGLEADHLTFDVTGQLYTAHHRKRQICRFDPGRKKSLPIALSDPKALSSHFTIRADQGGSLLVADIRQHRVLRVETGSGKASVVAGTGIPGFSGDGRPAVAAQLNSPHDVVADGQGNLFVSDFFNNRIRRVRAT